MRMQRETYFMKIAELTAERGTCNKLKVGAVLTKNPSGSRIRGGSSSGSSSNSSLIDLLIADKNAPSRLGRGDFESCCF